MSQGKDRIHEPPKQREVMRVLTAARECHAKWSTWSREHMPPECRRLMDAIEALDAPQERYCAHDQGPGFGVRRYAILDGRIPDEKVVGYAESSENAYTIVAALNASEQP